MRIAAICTGQVIAASKTDVHDWVRNPALLTLCVFVIGRARVGGITLRELNELEIEFFALIAFELFVLPESYQEYCEQLTNKALHGQCACSCRGNLPLPNSAKTP